MLMVTGEPFDGLPGFEGPDGLDPPPQANDRPAIATAPPAEMTSLRMAPPEADALSSAEFVPATSRAFPHNKGAPADDLRKAFRKSNAGRRPPDGQTRSGRADTLQ
jgi:hypothetical protein